MKSVVLVDGSDNEVGLMEVAAAHKGEGVLHRAVSVVVCRKGKRGTQMLLQKRADAKRLWPGFWSNAVCTHPAQGESYEEAGIRRLSEEMGIRIASADCRRLYRFRYQAGFDAMVSEHELDTVLGVVWDGVPQLDPGETSSCRWISYDALVREIASGPERFTPWFRQIVSDDRTKAWCGSL